MLSDMAVGRFPGTPPLPYTLVTLQEINHLALDLVHFLRPRPPTPSEQRPLAGDPESCRKPHPLTRRWFVLPALFNYNRGVKHCGLSKGHYIRFLFALRGEKG